VCSKVVGGERKFAYVPHDIVVYVGDVVLSGLQNVHASFVVHILGCCVVVLEGKIWIDSCIGVIQKN
jgi:hypothetical protein